MFSPGQAMRGPGYTSRWYARDDSPTISAMLCLGDRLEFDRGVYKHWAICVSTESDAQVVHRTGDSSDYVRTSLSSNGQGMGQICLESLLDVLSDYKVRINNCRDRTKRPRPAHAIVLSAVCAINNEKQHGAYSLLSNNCEHFANWCRYDCPESKQVQVAHMSIGAIMMLVAGALGTVVLRLLRN